MKNNELIKIYINGNKEAGTVNHIGFIKNDFYNYSTLICTIDRENKTAQFNNRKYSHTTGKIQNNLKYELNQAGYIIEEYEGPEAIPWNYGYQGAPTLKAAGMF